MNWSLLRPKNLETLVFIKYNLRAIEYSINLPLTPPGFVLLNAVCYEEAREESESNCDGQDEFDSVD